MLLLADEHHPPARQSARLPTKIIAKLQAAVSEAAAAEVELKLALRDALKQLKAALEQARITNERAQRERVETERAVRDFEARAAARDAERAALARRCRELESRDAARAADLSDRAAEAAELRAELQECRRELRNLRSDAAVNLTQQHYFETSVKAKRRGQRP